MFQTNDKFLIRPNVVLTIDKVVVEGRFLKKQIVHSHLGNETDLSAIAFAMDEAKSLASWLKTIKAIKL